MPKPGQIQENEYEQIFNESDKRSNVCDNNRPGTNNTGKNSIHIRIHISIKLLIVCEC